MAKIDRLMVGESLVGDGPATPDAVALRRVTRTAEALRGDEDDD